MYTKIAAMLDDVADSLEKKGLLKEALEVDKIADMIDAGMADVGGSALSKALSEDLKAYGKRTPPLEKVKEDFIATVKRLSGHGVSADKADKYVEDMEKITDVTRALKFMSNVMLAGTGLNVVKEAEEKPLTE